MSEGHPSPAIEPADQSAISTIAKIVPAQRMPLATAITTPAAWAPQVSATSLRTTASLTVRAVIGFNNSRREEELAGCRCHGPPLAGELEVGIVPEMLGEG